VLIRIRIERTPPLAGTAAANEAPAADLRSPPLRWLLEHRDSDSYRIECVGFGINLLSGNYEFACLILIDDEEWWRRFGSLIEANWEIERIRLYSSRDTDGLRDLMLDPRWSSEGLFAFTQGCVGLPSWLKAQGIDDALIQPYSGHEHRQSLEVYSRLSLADARQRFDEVIDRYPV
jgi:hypothetical protein